MNTLPPQGARDACERAPLVLVAEDDAGAAEMLKTILTRVGYEVRMARDGAEALRLAEEAPLPDVLLLDWMLPEVTGLEVCRLIREQKDALELPILMVTAKADAESVSAAFAAGASDYLTKPFLGAELRARVNAHLRIKQLSDERRELDEQLMEREKLAVLGLLVSGVAHDLNNPLGGIDGYAQLLLEQESDPERLVAIERILSEVQRCNRIVADLLSFAGRHAAARYSVAVADVLAQTLEMRERQVHARGLSMVLVVRDGIPDIVADPHQLQRVFLNILTNAEHALRDGGSMIRVTVEKVRRFGNLDWVVVHFFNDGPAIPRESLPQIFEPFFTTKGADDGTGLGLAICRRIVREHGGEIEVESGESGTTFSVVLPPELLEQTPVRALEQAMRVS
jgi:signal transduction histidine kinase